ncbi:hypothetical protein [Longispora albida]|uniref:hypothetical protein n=1 Tax=Longispora albida TaxID=203523 RepID=UPI000365BB15|nr:hypothetical protein [Longispora albida]
MRLSDHLTEPWGILTAVLAGGLGGAVTAALSPAAVLALPVGFGIGVTVYGVRVGLGALMAPRELEAPAPPRYEPRALPRPPYGSPAAAWLARAEAAAAALRSQAEGEPDPVLRAQVRDVGGNAEGVLADLVRFAGQVTLLEEASGRIDSDALRWEAAGLKHDAENGPAGLRAERERTLRAVTEQLAAQERMVAAAEALLAKMQATVAGLEGLVVRLAELSTLQAASDAGGDTAARVGLLTEDLEGLRLGLADAEELSRGALGS